MKPSATSSWHPRNPAPMKPSTHKTQRHIILAPLTSQHPTIHPSTPRTQHANTGTPTSCYASTVTPPHATQHPKSPANLHASTPAPPAPTPLAIQQPSIPAARLPDTHVTPMPLHPPKPSTQAPQRDRAGWRGAASPARPSCPAPSRRRAAPARVGRAWASFCRHFSAFPAAWP